MHKKIIYIFIIVTQTTIAQQMPIDFEESAERFIAFNGTNFSKIIDKDDNTNTVGEFVNSGANLWEGFYIDLQRPIELSNNQEISLNFYKFDAKRHNIILKLEQGGSNPDIEVKVDVESGNANDWTNTIVFDFANASVTGTNTTIDAKGTYYRLVIFIDGGDRVAGTYLIDNIDDGSEPIDFNKLDVEYTKLVWSDEFDGSSLNTEKWHHQTFGPNEGKWFNGEQQHYTDSPTNSYVENGNLHIVAKKEKKSQNGVPLDYTSARLNSKFAFTYGRVDIRAKLPKAKGTWPALWTLGKNITEEGAFWQTQGLGTTPWPDCGEIDIMEHGLHAENEVSSALHTRSSYGATVNTAKKKLTNVFDNYHVYSMNWSPNQITFLIDDEVYYTYLKPANFVDTNEDGINDAWPFDEDQFLLLNIAMGGVAGTIDANFTEDEMVIDYVRVYQSSNLNTDNFYSSKFAVYPNPAKDILYVKTEEEINKLSLYSMMGKLVKQQETSLYINVDDVVNGVYILKIQSGNKIVSKKIIVHKE